VGNVCARKRNYTCGSSVYFWTTKGTTKTKFSGKEELTQADLQSEKRRGSTTCRERERG